ncbi:MAG: hypothetical protein OXO48_01745 [Caldilineaceae bacterium]|nr:hypothetical protein [Caldilineaceae bacterium]
MKSRSRVGVAAAFLVLLTGCQPNAPTPQPLVTDLRDFAGLSPFFDFYNHERPHQSPDDRPPAEEHFVLSSEPAAFA